MRLMLVDEAARVPDEFYMAMRPMLAVGNGDLWLMSTPCGKRGFFFETWENGGPEWMRVAVPATECERITKAFLEEEKRTMPERTFRQEYLCEFTQSDDALFRYEDIMEVIDPELEPLIGGQGPGVRGRGPGNGD